jgi:Molecular chaperone GrpE (heat shock protein)
MPQRNSSTLNIRNPIEVEMQKSKQRALSRDSVKLAQLTSQFIAVSDQLSQFRELYLRQRAEMENYAKARDREMEQLKKNAGRDIIKNILPILDTMDSALSNSKDYSVISPIREQLMKLLSIYGLSEIPGKGPKNLILICMKL